MPFPAYDPTRARSLNGVWAFAFLGDLDGLDGLDGLGDLGGLDDVTDASLPSH